MGMSIVDENSYTKVERHQKLARLYLDCGDAQAALQHLESALRYCPDDAVLKDLHEEAQHFA